MRFRKLRKLLFLFLVFLIAKNTYGQTPISGVINHYASVTINATCNSVSISDPTGFNKDDRVLLIQMKGATVDGSNTATFGNITGIGNAGNYEFNEILDIQPGIIYLKYTLTNAYSNTGLQLIRVPQYTDVLINGTLTASPWNGSTGGVLVFEATGNVEFNADINVEGLGFRGGAVNTGTTNTCALGDAFTIVYSTASGTSGYGWKGEGISEYIASRQVARAYQANAGGGGHSSNTGAGGGSNYGTGGWGGRQSRPTSGTGGCSSTNGARGMGGISLSTHYSANKIFMGGGGGGGQQNNYIAPGPPAAPGATPGNPGGGIVIIKAQSITGNSYNIYAGGYNGKSLIRSTLGGFNTGTGTKYSFGDSGGGGGGGGTVLISSASGYTNTLAVDVSGGRGDTVFTEISIDLGPGGGGGGGVLWINDGSLPANITPYIAGGVAGASWHAGIAAVCQCKHQATDGSVGAIIPNLVLRESTTPFGPTCTTVPVKLIDFSAKEINAKIQLNWSTAMEINNDYFILEKSNDGFSYEFLTRVKGNGNSTTINAYVYTDHFPFTGNNYYRLKQVDYDGKEHIDTHIMINFAGNGEIIQKIYPNPFNQELTILVSTPVLQGETELKLFNPLGAEIISNPVFENEKIILNTSSLSKGVYILKITSQGKTEIRKVIKE
jgi:hypothetical protein